MKLKSLLALFACASIISFSGCDKDDDNNNGNNGGGSPAPGGPGKVTLSISNVCGSVNVDETGATTYTNALGEDFNVTMLKYYISNVELLTDTGSYQVPDSYFLVDENVPASTDLVLNNIPAANYTGVRFMIGVDNDKFLVLSQNTALAVGALDPANNMMWAWNAGYIHFKMEGSSSVSPSGGYLYHVGGMTGQFAGQRIAEVNFAGDSLVVSGTRPAEIHVLADVQKVFTGASDISLTLLYNTMNPDAKSETVANNYADLFTFDHLHND